MGKKVIDKNHHKWNLRRFIGRRGKGNDYREPLRNKQGWCRGESTCLLPMWAGFRFPDQPSHVSKVCWFSTLLWEVFLSKKPTLIFIWFAVISVWFQLESHKFINHCTIPWIPSLNKVYYYYYYYLFFLFLFCC